MAVNITISGNGLSFNQEIDFQKAGQIIAFLGREEGLPDSPLQATQPLSISSSSPKDWLLDANATTNAQKITVLGKHLSENENGFFIKDVQLQLKRMGETPGNFNRDLKTATALQYITPIDGKIGKYLVTDKGLEAILQKFSDEEKPKMKSKRKGGFKKAVPPRQEVISLPIVASLEHFPDFYDVPTKADSILWVLAYADINNLDQLSPREIEFLTDKLRNKVEHRDFSSHNKKNIKAGFVSSSNGMFKLQQKGMNHLKSLLPTTSNETE